MQKCNIIFDPLGSMYDMSLRDQKHCWEGGTNCNFASLTPFHDSDGMPSIFIPNEYLLNGYKYENDREARIGQQVTAGILAAPGVAAAPFAAGSRLSIFSRASLDASSATEGLPFQTHHLATIRNKAFTPQMEQIAGELDLELTGSWNTVSVPHLGRHPNAYHDFVLRGMQSARAGANGSQAEFLRLFDLNVKQPVIENPALLRKSGW